MQQIVQWLIDNILGQTSLFMGVIACIGLIVQKKSLQEIIEGTVITITGQVLFSAGTGLVFNAIDGVNNVLLPTISTGAGVYPYGDNVMSWVYTLDYCGQNIMQIFIISWFIHIFLVRIFNKIFKCVFLTVHMMLIQVSCNMLFFHYCMGLTGLPFYVCCIIMSVIFFTVSPMMVYKSAMEMSSGSFGLGHQQQFGAWFGGKIASLVGNPDESADDLQLPDWLKMFSSTTTNLSITMPAIFLIMGLIVAVVGNADALAVLDAQRGSITPVIWYLLQGFSFAAGVAVLQYGLRMFLGALVPAFQGFTQKIMPGCVPAIDCVAFFGFSPMGVVFSFLAYAVAGVLVSLGTLIFHSPVFVYPSMIMAFFDGGSIGVFSNHKGGWKGAIAAGFICGFLMHCGALIAALGMTGPAPEFGLAFGNFDTCVWNVLIFGIIRLITGK